MIKGDLTVGSLLFNLIARSKLYEKEKKVQFLNSMLVSEG